jgi:hypothetical protein
MKSVFKAICCEKCFENIAKRNTKAARTWIEFCSIYAIIGFDCMKISSDLPEIRMLETKGYLVSQEMENGQILVHMNGHYISDDKVHYFCTDRSNHGD